MTFSNSLLRRCDSRVILFIEPSSSDEVVKSFISLVLASFSHSLHGTLYGLMDDCFIISVPIWAREVFLIVPSMAPGCVVLPPLSNGVVGVRYQSNFKRFGTAWTVSMREISVAREVKYVRGIGTWRGRFHLRRTCKFQRLEGEMANKVM